MAASNPQADETPIDLFELARDLYEGRWWMALALTVCIGLAGVYAATAKRIYRADALLRVDYKDKALDPLQDSSAVFNADSPAEGEIDIIRSRAVVGEMFDQLARMGEASPADEKSRVDAINGFLANLTVSERGRNTGIIQLELLGPDRQLIARQLDALMSAYIRQDVKRRTAEAERRLNFVETQLPTLKSNLEEAEARLERYRAKNGNVEMALQAQSLLQQAAAIEAEDRKLQLEKQELRQRFSATNPNVLTLDSKRARLAEARRKVEAETSALPETELNLFRLNREVKVASNLYDLLLAKATELKIWKSGTIGSVRVVDSGAASLRPVSPRRFVNLTLGGLAGMVLGVLLALFRAKLRRGIRDLSALEKTFQLPVFGQVAHSGRQRLVERAIRRGERDLEPLARAAPLDPAVESLRALRASLQFGPARSASKVVMLTSSRRGAGRSFVAVNLAWLMAASGKRVLLVDGDLRARPLSQIFPAAQTPGLAGLLEGRIFQDCVHPTHLPLVHVLPAGEGDPLTTEKLSGARFNEAMEGAALQYDLILVVAPPVLAFADAAVLARSAGMTLVVVKAGEHSVEELALTLAKLRQAGVSPSGFVANRVPAAVEAAASVR